MAPPSFTSLWNLQRAKARAAVPWVRAVVGHMTGRVSVAEYQMEAEELGQLCFISIKVGADGQEAIQSSYSQYKSARAREKDRKRE